MESKYPVYLKLEPITYVYAVLFWDEGNQHDAEGDQSSEIFSCCIGLRKGS